MMALIRFVFLALVVAFVACIVMSRLTGDPVWRQRGMQVLKWGVVLGLIGFGTFILRRAAVFV